MAKEGHVGFKVTIVPDPEREVSLLVWSPTPGVCPAEGMEELMDELMEYSTESPYPWKAWHDWWNFGGSSPEEEVE